VRAITQAFAGRGIVVAQPSAVPGAGGNHVSGFFGIHAERRSGVPRYNFGMIDASTERPCRTKAL